MLPASLLLRNELEAVDRLTLEFIRTGSKDIDTKTELVLSNKGKQVRPLLLLLTSKMAGYDQGLDNSLYAAAIELLHSATLVHDDIVDNSTYRRGIECAHLKFGNKTSVLIGDHFFVRTLKVVTEKRNIDIIECFAKAASALVEGELFQLAFIKSKNIEEKDYLTLIEKKTAYLMGISTKIPGILMGKDTKAFFEFGVNFGMAFQIVDDVMDLNTAGEKIGKSTLLDLQNGMMTLPVIHLLHQGGRKYKALIWSLLKNENMDSKAEIYAELRDCLESTGAMRYALDLAQNYIRKNDAFLSSFEPSAWRDGLEELSNFVVQRSLQCK